ncbi:SnoaL-like polyketide cyclase [Geodermatophilus dictyosporus]|uniref:SnoaL-like polyketide cyclase n=1 Tax=Geodermatophilus dictyosporus TaxID=1523247 RepID=A0A1I5QM85_9ACTN|nr:ester cyclase [Geodermatophilus dictyosporus]SFP47207.1 SnoaL-like polyketide cyclase [Geodermatophilus dictyosporus]
MSGSGEQVRTLVRRLEEAMNARRLDALDDVLTPDFVRHCQATPDLRITSREQFTDFLRQDAAAFPDNVQTFRHILVDGDMAAIWATYEGTQTGQLGPFPPSGRRARFDVAGVLRVADGRIAELWITWDNVTVLGQLGHLPGA